MRSEKEKMINGEMYLSADETLVNERINARRLTRMYNNTIETEIERRREILEELLGQVGENIFIEPTFKCDYGYNIKVGDNFYANFDCIMLDGGGIEIGDNVLFGPRVGIYTSNHAMDAWERTHGACYAKPVRIGNNVWVGAGVHINQGVTIGDNTIIGSGSVITKDIPANVVAAGVPCKVIREITEADKTGYRP